MAVGMIRLPRRLLLAAPALLLARTAAAARLCPGRDGALSLTPDGNQAVFRCDGIDGAITLPDAEARIAMALPIAGRQVAGIAFAAAVSLDLVALVGWDNARLRILGLEVLRWQSADGAMLSSRFTGVGDRTRLLVAREAATPRPGLPRRWETWTDLLAWRDGAPLADAPVRTPLAGTMQARLAALRRRCTALLDPPLQTLTADMLASLDPARALE
jgi:hypothetical protein